MFSGGADHFTEMLLIEGQSAILDFLQEVALSDDPAKGGYRNPDFHVAYYDINNDAKDEYGASWEDLQIVPVGHDPIFEVLARGGRAAETTSGGGDDGDGKIGGVSESVVEIEDSDDDNGGNSNVAEDGSAKSERSDSKGDDGTKEAVMATGELESTSQSPAKGQGSESKEGQQELETRLDKLEIQSGVLLQDIYTEQQW